MTTTETGDEMTDAPREAAFDPSTIERPDEALLHYYVAVSALTIIGFPFVFVPFYLKYRTLRYRFDDKGVSMSWGLIFRREVYLTYRRIQDIHVTRNLFHRWLGLSEVAVQTASGSSGAEMKIEGIRNPEALRDFLYSQMRGARDGDDDADVDATTPDDATSTPEAAGATPSDRPAPQRAEDEALALLREIRDELRARRSGRPIDATADGDPEP